MAGKITMCLLWSLAIVALSFAPVLIAEDAETTGETKTETQEAAPSETTEVHEYTLWQMFKDSLPVGLFIVLCSIAAVALAIENFFTIRRNKLIPPDLLQDIEELLEDENYEDVMETCAAEAGYFTNIIGAALPRVKDGYQSMMEIAHSVADEESVKLQQKISWLQFIAAIAPMLGLLGTVTGMITGFNVIANLKGAPKPKDLAGGIREALVTTAQGLFVAIPTMAFYFYFRNKVVKISMEINGVVEELFERFREKSS